MEIRNLHPYINQSHKNIELIIAQAKHLYVDKWVSNDLINHHLSNHFWKDPRIIDTQIKQTLNFQYAPYIYGVPLTKLTVHTRSP